MNDELKIKIISQGDLINSYCFDINWVIKIVENTLLKYDQNNVIFPDKISVIFDENSQNRINCMPAGFLDEKIYGMKWVSVFPENPKIYNIPNVSAVYILSELSSGFPIAFMDGKMISALRTAAMGAVAAKYLAKKDSKVIGFIGAGEEAKAHLMAMKAVYPGLEQCRVSSRTSESEERFVSQMGQLYPDIKFITTNSNYEKAVNEADIIVTAISGQQEILKSKWIKEGAFYCHVAGLEDEYAVAFLADKIVVDSWNDVKHRTQTLSRMYTEGLIKDEDIYADLYEIIKGHKPGRENEQEFIYFNSVGLSYIDTAVAYSMYKKVVQNGLGTEMKICNESIFDVDNNYIIR